MEGLIFKEDTHQYFLEGIELVSVTKIISTYLNQYRGVPAELMKQAGAFGTAVHSMCEMWIAQTLDIDALDPQLEPYLNGFLKFHAEKIGCDAVKVENKMFSKRLMLAGTADIITPGAIYDIKTRAYSKKTDPLQLAAYDKLDGGSGNMKNHYVVEILPDNYKLTRCNEKQAWPTFKAMLDHYHATNKLETIITGWEKR